MTANSQPAPQATLVITTRNRKDELRDALASAQQQTVPLEIIVMDDFSDDGTSEMVRAEFPSVRLERSAEHTDLIKLRNQAYAMASTPYIVTIDDDEVFTAPDVVETTLAGFGDPHIGAVTIPYVNVKISDRVNQPPPADTQHIWVTSWFAGGANALRRDVFMALGGFRGMFERQGEEGDFCLRMVDAGYVVRVGHAAPLHHFVSPTRDRSRMAQLGRRNDILTSWFNTPMPMMPLEIATRSVRGIIHGVKVGRPGESIWGLLRGCYRSLAEFSSRRPVRAESYRLYRRLQADGPVRFDEVKPSLRPVGETASGSAPSGTS